METINPNISINHPNASQVLVPKSKPKKPKGNKQHRDFIDFNQKEMKMITLPEMQSVRVEEFFEFDVDKLKETCRFFLNQAYLSGFQDTELSSLTIFRQFVSYAKFAKIFTLQFLYALMYRVYLSVDQSDLGLVTAYKGMFNAQCTVLVSIDQLAAQIGMFHIEDRVCNFSHPVSLLGDLASLFNAVYNGNFVVDQALNQEHFEQVVDQIMNLDQWNEIGRGINTNAAHSERVFLDAIRRECLPSYEITYPHSQVRVQIPMEVNENTNVQQCLTLLQAIHADVIDQARADQDLQFLQGLNAQFNNYRLNQALGAGYLHVVQPGHEFARNYSTFVRANNQYMKKVTLIKGCVLSDVKEGNSLQMMHHEDALAHRAHGVEFAKVDIHHTSNNVTPTQLGHVAVYGITRPVVTNSGYIIEVVDTADNFNLMKATQFSRLSLIE